MNLQKRKNLRSSDIGSRHWEAKYTFINKKFEGGIIIRIKCVKENKKNVVFISGCNIFINFI